MKSRKRLIMIPTYNELENSSRLCKELLNLKLKNTDIFFVDDNSPDGTGEILDKIAARNNKVKVLHRSKKDGIGSAHLSGILWAYDHHYSELITMDCDFTHSPNDIPKMIKVSDKYDVVVGSRYLKKDSLKGWNVYRKALTQAGHFVTKYLLNLKYDASGAFRLYRLDIIPKKIFKKVTSKRYSFFLESLYIISLNRFKIGEVPIKLPPRTYGHSKMRLHDVLSSMRLILSLYFKFKMRPEKFKV